MLAEDENLSDGFREINVDFVYGGRDERLLYALYTRAHVDESVRYKFVWSRPYSGRYVFDKSAEGIMENKQGCLVEA